MTNPSPSTGGYALGTMLTLREIADLTGHDLSTIKTWNAKGQGRWPNAIQDPDGLKTWRVPVEDLVATGFLNTSEILDVESKLVTRRESRETWSLREQIVRLEEQLRAVHTLAEERAATIVWLKDLISRGGAA